MLPAIRTLLVALCALALAMAPACSPRRGPLVLAAASLQEAMADAAKAWTVRGHAPPVLSFAASSALARQVEAGAPADLFVSADELWMDHVAARGLVAPGTRADLLANRLVLVAPAASRTALRIDPHFPLARALGNGRLAIADPDAVPAGKYGKAALVLLGVWDGVEGRLARAENVRSALALVERGETPLGIVYATDAIASAKVRVVDTFPPESHPPITYPIAKLTSSTHADTDGFLAFLRSPEGRAIFARRGFSAP